jgi:hypothetical protein
MDIFMFLRFADAIRVIYDIGFEPREDSFTECTFDSINLLNGRAMIELNNGSW